MSEMLKLDRTSLNRLREALKWQEDNVNLGEDNSTDRQALAELGRALAGMNGEQFVLLSTDHVDLASLLTARNENALAAAAPAADHMSLFYGSHSSTPH